VHVTNGGTHAIYVAMQALLEPGDEVIVPDPEWPPTMAIIRAASAVPVAVPLHESLGWRWISMPSNAPSRRRHVPSISTRPTTPPAAC
jgi:aspartate/methionine/tyrosine aminotransferase